MIRSLNDLIVFAERSIMLLIVLGPAILTIALLIFWKPKSDVPQVSPRGFPVIPEKRDQSSVDD